MLPIMALCWAALFFRAKGLDNYLDAAVEARRTSWLFSNQGCEVENPEDDRGPPGTDVQCLPSESGWMDALASVPFVRTLIGSLTGFKLTTVIKREHQAPILLGSVPSTATYNYQVMCNEKTRNAGDVLRFVLCQELQNLGLSLDFAVDCPPAPPKSQTCLGP